MQADKKLIQRFKDGEAEAFDSIYRIYNKKLFHFTLGLVKNEGIAKDLVQEVFVNLWQKSSQVNTDLNFDNYIFTCTYNSIRKYFRNKTIERKVMDNLSLRTLKITESVDKTFIFNELLEIAEEIIEKLPPRRRTVYKLSRQEGLKIKEIAEKMNISSRTAENHLAKALKSLKEELSSI